MFSENRPGMEAVMFEMPETMNQTVTKALNRFILSDMYDEIVKSHYLGFEDKKTGLTYLRDDEKGNKEQLLFKIDFLKPLYQNVNPEDVVIVGYEKMITMQLEEKVFVLPKGEKKTYFTFDNVVIDEENIPTVTFVECGDDWKTIVDEQWIEGLLKDVQTVLDKHGTFFALPMGCQESHIDNIKEELDVLVYQMNDCPDAHVLGYQVMQSEEIDKHVDLIVNLFCFIDTNKFDKVNGQVDHILDGVVYSTLFEEKGKAVLCNHWGFDYCGFARMNSQVKEKFNTVIF